MSNYTPEQIAAIQHEFIYGKSKPKQPRNRRMSRRGVGRSKGLSKAHTYTVWLGYPR